MPKKEKTNYDSDIFVIRGEYPNEEVLMQPFGPETRYYISRKGIFNILERDYPASELATKLRQVIWLKEYGK